jgi:hypothetical protein
VNRCHFFEKFMPNPFGTPTEQPAVSTTLQEAWDKAKSHIEGTIQRGIFSSDQSAQFCLRITPTNPATASETAEQFEHIERSLLSYIVAGTPAEKERATAVVVQDSRRLWVLLNDLFRQEQETAKRTRLDFLKY